MQEGVAATAIEELVEAAGITKSGFFYHFKDKNDLARQFLERYLAESEIVLDQIEVRARELDDDPLPAFLYFLKLYSEIDRKSVVQGTSVPESVDRGGRGSFKKKKKDQR